MLVLYFVCICQRLPRINRFTTRQLFLFVFYPLPKSNVANIIEFYIAKEKKFLRGNFPNNITVHNFRKQRNKMYSRDI